MNSLIEAQVQRAICSMSGKGFMPNPDFLYFDGYSQRQLDGMAKAKPKQRSAAEPRLVRGSKSRTPTFKPFSVESARSARQLIPLLDADFVGPKVHDRQMLEDVPEGLEKRDTRGPGKYTVLHFREWSDEYRIRTRVDVPAAMPQAPEGPRISWMLSDRAARNIADSCHYMALHKGGYKTFVTGTFSAEKREAIASGETTIQREVTRTMDALKKMYIRGWVTEKGEKVPPAAPMVEVTKKDGLKVLEREALPYCWVVEVPANENGEENPHVHMILAWSVEYRHFKEWAARLERLWGNGYFHLEKIKEPENAGAYMAKAAGYMSKANGQSDQGRVKGNRYGISKPARAPGWACLGEYELGLMGRIISEVHEHIQEKYAADRQERAKLTRQRAKAKSKDDRAKIGQKLARVRAKLNAVKVRASKYQLICKGKQALTRFMGFAQANGWQPGQRPHSLWLAEYNKRREVRRHRRFMARISSAFSWCYREFKSVLAYGERADPDAPLIDWGEYEQLGAAV